MGFISSSLIPAGVVFPYVGTTAPTGYLLCEGQEVSRPISAGGTVDTYKDLYAAIGTSYGVGNGTSTFNVPDTRNVFLRGANASTRTIGSISYPAVPRGTTTNDKMQGHRHPRNTNGTGENIVDAVAGGAGVPAGASRQILYTNTGNASVDDGSNGTPRTGTETAPVHLGINHIIKF